MGNLYTTIVRISNPRIVILSKLKQLWNSSPRDFKQIQELQAELRKLDAKKTLPKKQIGALERGYLSRIATRGKT